MTIHWCGTGLSAIPGLRGLLADGHEVVVWNRTPETARAAVGDLTDAIRPFEITDLSAALRRGDVIVSMLPGDWHVALAAHAISKQANFVSSSYISPQMRALDAGAREAGVALVNEVGLDPGIDHLMAHRLMARYRASAAFDPANSHVFHSYCGGVPARPNAFRYKFSWSPLGVLKALDAPSRSIRGGEVLEVDRPWHALSDYTAPLPTPETFEVYPNRDSLPFMAEYGIGQDWQVDTFVRGTLRLQGWAKAWAPIFREIEALDGEAGEARLRDMSRALWADHAYEEGEADRVVLVVDLRADRGGTAAWRETFVLDATGDARGSAMARLVSTTVALATQAAAARRLRPGVQAAPSDPATVAAWLDRIAAEAQHMQITHVAG